MIKKRALFYVGNLKIVGNAYVAEGFRITDHLNRGDIRFIPLTEVVVLNERGKIIQKEDFVCINKDHILMAKDVIGEVK